MAQLPLSLLVAWAGFACGMAVAWWVDRRTGNAGWVDVAWTVSLTLATALGIWTAAAMGAAIDPLSVTVTMGLVGLWALRLAGHLAARSRSKEDDPRYRKMRDEWGDRAPTEMAKVLQWQALASLPLVFSLLMAATVPGPFVPLLVLPGVFVSGLGLWVGWKADRDLRVFKQSQSGLCTVGLWRLSRHPNYVGEILFWTGIALLSLGHGLAGWLAGLGPLTIYLLLRFVSGVPPLEAHMAAKHGASFEAYRASTPVLFPWPISRRNRHTPAGHE